MKHWKVILAAALIFATGATTGALAYRAANKSSARSSEPGGPPPMMDRRFDFLGRLKKDLTLTEDQAKKIDVILQDGSRRTRQLWDTIQPQMRDEMKKVNELIKAELTPEQGKLFDENSRKFRERRGSRSQGTNSTGEPRHRGPGPFPPPPLRPADSDRNPETPVPDSRPSTDSKPPA